MAQEAKIDGNLINDARPLAVETQNAAGAEAVNIQDGGNSITVDGAVTSTPAASELHIGQVGGEGIRIQVTPTISAAAIYAAGDAVGGLLTFANAARVTGGSGVIKNVLLIDDAGQDAALELWLFNATFTAMADNAAWAPSEADLRKLICVIPTSDGAYYAAGTPSVCDIECARAYNVTGTSLFGQLVTRGAPTYTATDDISVSISLMQD